MTSRTHAVGGQELTTSVDGLGTMGMTAMYGTPNDAESIQTIHQAIDLGITLFDTADMYGPHSGEELVGRAIAPYRDQVVVATKLSLVPQRLAQCERGIDREFAA
jgi:aryl-alcohol dehydrogenase-like predicted oxidoreductase